MDSSPPPARSFPIVFYTGAILAAFVLGALVASGAWGGLVPQKPTAADTAAVTSLVSPAASATRDATPAPRSAAHTSPQVLPVANPSVPTQTEARNRGLSATEPPREASTPTAVESAADSATKEKKTSSGSGEMKEMDPNRYLKSIRKGDKVVFRNVPNPGKPNTAENRAIKFTNNNPGLLGVLSSVFTVKKKIDIVSLVQSSVYHSVMDNNDLCSLNIESKNKKLSSVELMKSLRDEKLEFTLAQNITIIPDHRCPNACTNVGFDFIDIPVPGIPDTVITGMGCAFPQYHEVVKREFKVVDLNNLFGEHARLFMGPESIRALAGEKKTDEKTPSKKIPLKKEQPTK